MLFLSLGRKQEEIKMSKKILIIDDDPAIVRYLTVLFSDNGYATCSATDGKEAYEVYLREEPDLITLDLEMPEEWGPRFYRKISKIKGFDTPVIVVSGLPGQKYSISRAVAAFSKPFDREELLAAVKKIIG